MKIPYPIQKLYTLMLTNHNTVDKIEQDDDIIRIYMTKHIFSMRRGYPHRFRISRGQVGIVYFEGH